MDVAIIGMTSINWKLLNSMFPDIKPTKRLDDAGILINDPASFCFCYGTTFSTRMIHLMILFKTDEDSEYCELMQNLNGIIHSKEEVKRDYVIFTSASLDTWWLNILAMCTKESSTFVRRIGNDLLITLEKSWFIKQMISNHKKISQSDGTFIICK